MWSKRIDGPEGRDTCRQRWRAGSSLGNGNLGILGQRASRDDDLRARRLGDGAAGRTNFWM